MPEHLGEGTGGGGPCRATAQRRRPDPLRFPRHAGRLRNRHRAGVPRRTGHRHQDVLRVRQRVRRPPELERLPRVSGPPWDAPGAQREVDRVHGEDRPRPRLPDRGGLAVPPEELLLSGHAEELPDLSVRPPALRRRPSGRPGGRAEPSDRHHPGPSRGGHGEDDARRDDRTDRRGGLRARRLQPGGDPACRSGLRARRSKPGGGSRVPDRAPDHPGGARRLGRPHGGGISSVRREHQRPARRLGGVRDEGRDQEPQFDPLPGASPSLRGGASARGVDRGGAPGAGDAALG